jgi:hypothetical protein
MILIDLRFISTQNTVAVLAKYLPTARTVQLGPIEDRAL